MSSSKNWLPIDPEMAREVVQSQRWLEKVRVNPDTGCHEWQAAKDTEGYGYIRMGGKRLAAHRVIAVAVRGADLPIGYVPDHLCKVTCCVNLEHLEIVPMEENSRRSSLAMDRAQRTHCPQGHPLIQGNLVDDARARHKGQRGWCLACCNVHQEARQQIIGQAAQKFGLTQRAYAKIYGKGPNKAREVLGLPVDGRPLERLVFDGVIVLPPEKLAKCLAHLDDLVVEA